MIYFAFVTPQKNILDFSHPFVIFRKPGSTHIQYWKSHSQAQQVDIENVFQSGKEQWAVAPFSYYQSGQVWAFPADEKHTFAHNHVDGIEIYAYTPEFSSRAHVVDTQKNDFMNWVESAAQEMKDGKYRKTALSKVRNKELSAEFNWMNWLNAACAQFPNAMVFFVHIPGAHTWAGATPELFLSAQTSIVRSVSLAGTLHPDSASGWSDKEREEQGFVTDYIRDVFIQSGFEDVEVTGPETVHIGKLSHLKTFFSARQNGDIHKLSNLVARLHPTPAVGGLPKKEGVEAILKNETHAREWYSGFLGTIDANGNTDLFVNLRSMQVSKGKALLYAGAGITAQSRAEAEWLETENKLRMNLDLLEE